MQSFRILELLQDSYDPPLTRERIEALERELGIRLPKEYAEFLLQFNGGQFTRPVLFYVPNATSYPEGVGVEFFFGDPGDRRAQQGLTWHAETLSGRVPDDFLAVAACNSLDLALLKVAGEVPDFGSVWFWDGTEEGEGNNIHWVADSFNEFLSMLQYDTYYDYEEHETIPVFLAVERGNLRAVARFLEHGGAVDSRNAQGQTLLAAAAIYSWPKIVRLLLEHSADPNARDEPGRTPLHHAAEHSIDSVKLILEAGADARARDRHGKSVLAQWSYRADQILRAHGATD